MKDEDLEKLLGGYATETLDEDERRQLFEAALNDQELFNSLAGEEALRELLSDARSKRELLGRLPDRLRVQTGFQNWFRRPAAWAAMATLAAATVLVTFLPRWGKPPSPEFAPVAVARAPVSPAPMVAPPAPASIPKPEARRLAVARPAPTSPASLGLRYRILRRQPGREYAEVEPAATFHSGDALRLKIEPAENGFLYVLSKTGTNWNLLFPSSRVQRRVSYTLPPERDLELGEEPGPRELLIVFSRTAEGELESQPERQAMASQFKARMARPGAAASAAPDRSALLLKAPTATASRVVIPVTLRFE